MNLSEISFPVFKLRNRPPETSGTVSYYISERFNQDNAEYKKTVYIVDDTSIDEPTLSRRRLVLMQQGVKLLKISAAIYFLADLIKQSTSTQYWIDSTGKIFKYKKTTRAKLKFYRVEAIYPIKGLGAVIQVQNLPQRFKVLFYPSQELTWAGVLEWDHGQRVLYGLYPTQHNETWRLV